MRLLCSDYRTARREPQRQQPGAVRDVCRHIKKPSCRTRPASRARFVFLAICESMRFRRSRELPSESCATVAALGRIEAESHGLDVSGGQGGRLGLFLKFAVADKLNLHDVLVALPGCKP